MFPRLFRFEICLREELRKAIGRRRNAPRHLRKCGRNKQKTSAAGTAERSLASSLNARQAQP